MGRLGFACAALLAPAMVLGGDGFWTSNGPSGGRIVSLQIDPSPAAIHYASSRGGLYRSNDGGTSWTRVGNGLTGAGAFEPSLHMDRDRPQRLHLVDGSGRMMRSTDGGLNWLPTGFDARAAQATPFRYADVPGPSRNGEFYFTVRFSGSFPSNGVYKTVDDGATFTLLSGLPAGRGMPAIAVSPTNPDLVLAGGDNLSGTVPGVAVPQLWRSVDGGATWTVVLEAVPSSPTTTVFAAAITSISFGSGGNVYASTQGGILHSADNGVTWTGRSLLTGGVFVNPTTLVAHPAQPGTVIVGSTVGTVVVTAADTASPVVSALSTTLTPNPSFTDSNVPPRPIQASVAQLVLSPDFPAPGSAVWAITDHAGLFRSADGGATWSDAVNQRLSAVNVRAVAVHPNPLAVGVTPPDTRIYAGFGDPSSPSQALWRSINNGFSWDVANTGLRAAQVRGIAIDPTTTNSILSTVLYAAGRGSSAGFAGSPPGNNFLSRNGGLYKSTNGGNTWTTIDATLPTRTFGAFSVADIGLVRTVLLDPRSCTVGPPPGPTGPRCTASTGPLRTIWATADGFTANLGFGSGTPFSHRIVRSDDGGATWVARDNGIPNRTSTPTVDQWVFPVPLIMDPADSNVLYTGTALRFVDSAPTPGAPTIQNGVFKSVDGGANWTFSSIGLPFRDGSSTTRHDVLALGISGRDSQRLWAATSTVTGTSGNLTSLYRSLDGGLTWTEARAGIPPGLDIRAITVDTPASTALAEAIYVAGGGTVANPGAVYRSLDGGNTWVSISIGLPADSALAVTTDPRDRRRVLAGTNLGVWELTQQPDIDGDGAPDFNENNAPNGGDGNGDGEVDSTQGDVGSTIVLFRGPSGRGFGGCDGQFTTEIVNSAQCPQARDVQQVEIEQFPTDLVPAGDGRAFQYPLRGVRFEVPQCQQATVEITFHQAGLVPGICPDFNDYQWSFRFYGPQVPGDNSTVGWFDLGKRATRVGPKKWRLTLDAGQFGSYRPNDPANPSNNAVLFIGGPALSGDRVFRSGFEPGGN